MLRRGGLVASVGGDRVTARVRALRKQYPSFIVRRKLTRCYALWRDGNRCTVCGSDDLTHLQACHVTHEKDGGLYSLGNLVTKCAYCHGAEHGRRFIGSFFTRA